MTVFIKPSVIEKNGQWGNMTAEFLLSAVRSFRIHKTNTASYYK